ncbi:Nucleoside diphosphate kinase B [Myotis brandtii]|uniref:Nucleoside diphosphate kinase n=1 Tax=Myotis brandtii TaxID=109478 RepID=S7MZH3_MYOBR|nr:PREDICTED: putative nucleoside diphosphate kinase isoform X1 [Myotis brandtii]EPQ08985.1 Nucleoside diphosphate kinase B [Myotis brandtii]
MFTELISEQELVPRSHLECSDGHCEALPVGIFQLHPLSPDTLALRPSTLRITTSASEDLLKQHYIDLKDRPFYPGLVKYMNSGPVVAMVWEGLNVVKTGRMMLGETNPADSKPGTIRGDFCIQVGRNIIHGSDSVKSAEREISLWFKPEELVNYKSCAFDWIYE